MEVAYEEVRLVRQVKLVEEMMRLELDDVYTTCVSKFKPSFSLSFIPLDYSN